MKIHYTKSRELTNTYYAMENYKGNRRRKDMKLYRTICGCLIEEARRTKDSEKVTCKGCITILSALRLLGNKI